MYQPLKCAADPTLDMIPPRHDFMKSIGSAGQYVSPAFRKLGDAMQCHAMHSKGVKPCG